MSLLVVHARLGLIPCLHDVGVEELLEAARGIGDLADPEPVRPCAHTKAVSQVDLDDATLQLALHVVVGEEHAEVVGDGGAAGDIVLIPTDVLDLDGPVATEDDLVACTLPPVDEAILVHRFLHPALPEITHLASPGIQKSSFEALLSRTG